MKTSVVRVVLASLIAALTLVPAGASRALDQADLSVSRKEPNQTKAYGPIPGNNTSLTHLPSDCRSAPYCDVIDMKINTAGFASDDLYQAEISVAWDNGAANDMDIYIYDSKEKRVGQSASSDDPEHTVLDLPDTATYYLVINNFTGPNTGYTVDLTLSYEGKQKGIPEFNRATPRPQFTPLPEATARPVPTQNLAPESTLAPVVTPGADGARKSMALEAVEAGAKQDNGGAAWWIVLLSVVAALGVLAGGGVLVLRRVRARA